MWKCISEIPFQLNEWFRRRFLPAATTSRTFSGRGKNTRVLMSETRLNATRTILMGSFMKNEKRGVFIFNFLSKLGCCSQEYKSRKIPRNLVNPEVIIAPTKTGKTQIFIAKFPLYPRCQIVFLGATELSAEATEVSHEVKSRQASLAFQDFSSWYVSHCSWARKPLASTQVSPLPPHRRCSRLLRSINWAHFQASKFSGK